MILLLLFAFLAGVVTILSPCILPILPAILSAGTLQGKWRPLGIVLGLVVSFTFFTLTLTAIVQATGLNPDILRYIAIGLLVLFALVMIFPKLSEKFALATSKIASAGQKVQEKGSKKGFFGGLLFGVALGLLWTPCAGPILAAITTLVATQAINIQTFMITLSYSIGAGLPMLLIAYGGAKIIQSSRFLTKYSERIRQIFGFLMLLAAVAIFFHFDMYLQEQIARFFPTIMIEDTPAVKKELEKIQGPKEELVSKKAPELTGIVNWINSPPLSLMQLRGKVVLIDFWTYSCINCLRTLPYLERWYAEYKDKGFVIIGVHTPEFEFEKSPQNVAAAAARLGVKYPIAQDNDYKTWQAYHNQFWPAHYLIDQKGIIVSEHFGEGNYLETENEIRKLLGLKPLEMEVKPQEAKTLTPETYLGKARADSYNKTVFLKGPWKHEEEKIVSESNESTIELHFLASKVYLVMTGTNNTPMKVTLDGKEQPDIKIESDKEYTVASTTYGNHILILKVPKGVSAYVFTFGQ